MLPHFNSHLYNPNNQPLTNGTNTSAPQQVMGNQSNFFHNPMQMLPQFQLGMLNSPQLAVPPFSNPNAYFTPTQLFPFPQAHVQNLNNNNMPQPFLHNNQPHFLPNGQFNVPNLVQNVNQLMQMQMPNAQLGLLNSNGVVQPPSNGDSSRKIEPGAATPQGNTGENGWRKSHNKNSNWNPKRDASQRGLSKQQFHHKQNAKRNFRFNDNRVKEQHNVGAKNFTISNSCSPNQVGKKRSLMLNYSAQEVQQWREERKKNYPSKTNIEKKLKVHEAEPEVTDAVTKARRQQLKEILAKQAELGCEVAEVPSFYLSDSEQQADNSGVKKRVFDKRGRFQNKFDKWGKNHQNDRFSKRQKPMYHNPANLQNRRDRFAKNPRWTSGSTSNPHKDNKIEPSLLKKLLSSDINRDKKHLLQVFRFMVMNSFFKNWPEKPLNFPEVIVRETGNGSSEIIDEMPRDEEGEITD